MGRLVEKLITIVIKIKAKFRLGAMAYTCNPSYLGGRNQENQDLRPAWAKVVETTFQPTRQVWWHTL
jgi:hypothetical protein